MSSRKESTDKNKVEKPRRVVHFADENKEEIPRRVVNVDDPKYKVLLQMMGREHLTNYLLTAPLDSSEASGSQARPAGIVGKHETVTKFTGIIPKASAVIPHKNVIYGEKSVPPASTSTSSVSASSGKIAETNIPKCVPIYESSIKAANPKYQYVLDLLEQRKQLTHQLLTGRETSIDTCIRKANSAALFGKQMTGSEISMSFGKSTASEKIICSETSTDVLMSFGATSEPFLIVEPDLEIPSTLRKRDSKLVKKAVQKNPLVECQTFDEDTIELIPSILETCDAATEENTFEIIDASNVEELLSSMENFTIIDPLGIGLASDETDSEYEIP